MEHKILDGIRIQRIKRSVLATLLMGAGAVCPAARAQVTVAVAPNFSSLQTNGMAQFTATVSGTINTAVTWQVNGITGGSATLGTVSSAGLYLAPAAVPNPPSVNVTAVSQADPFAFASATAAVGAGSVFYVSTTGNDANNGSLGAPWRTMQHAASTVTAGDTVYAMGGLYGEVVTLPHSGSAAAGYIVFENYAGETATLDGTGLAVPNGMYGLFTINSQSYLIVDGFEVRNYSTGSAQSVPIGIFIEGAGDYIQILNNHIHNISTTVKNANGNAFGMTVYGTQAPAALNNLVFSGNEIDHLTTGSSESFSLDGNVTNWSITNNVVHDNNNIAIGAIGFEGVSHNPKYDQARLGEISGNTVYNITSFGNPAYGNQYSADGIYVDGGTEITIERNVIHNTDLGIELASEHHSHNTSLVTARSNLIYSTNSAGISIGGYASTVGGTTQCDVVNNTLFGNDTKNTGSGEFQIQFHATNNLFENNIAYATTQGLLVNSYTKSSPNGATMDHNLYFSTVGAGNATFLWNGKTYTGFRNYQTKTGKDAHSSFADPQFLSLALPNLQVQATSPAVNTGSNLGLTIEGPFDFAGNPRVQGTNIDIGAYEQP